MKFVYICIVEKHFTLDKTLEGPDHKASLNPVEFKAMVDAIRNVEVAMGDGVRKFSENELEIKKIAQVISKSFEISDDEGYAVAKDVEVTDEEVKEQAVEAMESCPTSAIEEAE